MLTYHWRSHTILLMILRVPSGNIPQLFFYTVRRERCKSRLSRILDASPTSKVEPWRTSNNCLNIDDRSDRLPTAVTVGDAMQVQQLLKFAGQRSPNRLLPGNIKSETRATWRRTSIRGLVLNRPSYIQA